MNIIDYLFRVSGKGTIRVDGDAAFSIKINNDCNMNLSTYMLFGLHR